MSTHNINKHATKVYFIFRSVMKNVSPLVFNNSIVSIVNAHKTTGLVLDSKFSFRNHINENISIIKCLILNYTAKFPFNDVNTRYAPS